MNKISKMVLLTAKIEETLPGSARLKLAKKRFLTAQESTSKDKAKESSKQVEDTEFKKNQKEVDEDSGPSLK